MEYEMQLLLQLPEPAMRNVMPLRMIKKSRVDQMRIVTLLQSCVSLLESHAILMEGACTMVHPICTRPCSRFWTHDEHELRYAASLGKAICRF